VDFADHPDHAAIRDTVGAITRSFGGGDWVLNGTKYYISGAEGAAAILVVARTGTVAQTGHGLLSLFLVPPDALGLTAQPLPVAAAL
jgi:alkylation response protein AidB-like acyl-CoA dehydrogenase